MNKMFSKTSGKKYALWFALNIFRANALRASAGSAGPATVAVVAPAFPDESRFRHLEYPVRFFDYHGEQVRSFGGYYADEGTLRGDPRTAEPPAYVSTEPWTVEMPDFTRSYEYGHIPSQWQWNDRNYDVWRESLRIPPDMSPAEAREEFNFFIRSRGEEIELQDWRSWDELVRRHADLLVAREPMRVLIDPVAAGRLEGGAGDGDAELPRCEKEPTAELQFKRRIHALRNAPTRRIQVDKHKSSSSHNNDGRQQLYNAYSLGGEVMGSFFSTANSLKSFLDHVAPGWMRVRAGEQRVLLNNTTGASASSQPHLNAQWQQNAHLLLYDHDDTLFVSVPHEAREPKSQRHHWALSFSFPKPTVGTVFAPGSAGTTVVLDDRYLDFSGPPFDDYPETYQPGDEWVFPPGRARTITLGMLVEKLVAEIHGGFPLRIYEDVHDFTAPGVSAVSLLARGARLRLVGFNDHEVDAEAEALLMDSTLHDLAEMLWKKCGKTGTTLEWRVVFE